MSPLMNKTYAVKDLPEFLKSFLPKPLDFMKSGFQMTWPAVFFLIAACAAISGTISGLISHRFYDVLTGLFLFPITSLVSSLVFGFFIYYFFSLFRSTFLDFRRLMSVVVAAFIPYFLFHAVSAYLPPIDLLGFAFTGLLLIVGLVEQFSLERRICSRLVAGLGLVFFAAWSISQIASH